MTFLQGPFKPNPRSPQPETRWPHHLSFSSSFSSHLPLLQRQAGLPLLCHLPPVNQSVEPFIHSLQNRLEYKNGEKGFSNFMFQQMANLTTKDLPSLILQKMTHLHLHLSSVIRLDQPLTFFITPIRLTSNLLVYLPLKNFFFFINGHSHYCKKPY